jgi:hypothetical protein
MGQGYVHELILVELCRDVKDLLLTMLNPTTLSQAIAQAMHCDNRLFER